MVKLNNFHYFLRLANKRFEKGKTKKRKKNVVDYSMAERAGGRMRESGGHLAVPERRPLMIASLLWMLIISSS